jgi:hypothetical protein
MENKDWEIETIRLTLFTPDAPSQQNLGWWNSVTSSDPENVANKPAMGIFTASGLVNDLTLTLTIGPGRIDWVLVGARTDDSPLASIGPVGVAMKKFHELLDDWINRKPAKATRIALGVGARSAAKSKVDAYTKISSYLPQLKVDPVGSSELLYQINRPRPSRAMPPLSINRLSKWNVVTFTVAAVTASGPGVPTPLAVFYVAETDINTSPENEKDLADSMPAIIRELEELTGEVLEKGDLP